MASMELQGEKEKQGCKVFIGGLTLDTTSDMLKDFYSNWGDIIDAVVMTDAVTKRSRGFGFVTYSNPQSVDACLRDIPHKIDDKLVETKRAVPREDSTPHAAPMTTKKVFLGGLHLDTTKDKLREELSRYGEIEDICIMRNIDTGKSRGFGFVAFKDLDSVEKLCTEGHVSIQGRDVEVKKAVSGHEQQPHQQSSSHDYNQSYGGISSQASYHPRPPHHVRGYSDYAPPQTQHYHSEYPGGYGGYGGGGPPGPYRAPYNAGVGVTLAEGEELMVG